MVNVQQSPQDGWLQSNNTVLISALAAITVATSSVLLWCCQRSILLQDTAHAPKVIPEEVPRDVTRQRSEQCTQGKISRSKERRRRGKDSFKEFSKGGKNHKELLRQLNRASTASNGVSTTATLERDSPQPEKFTCETDESPSIQTSDSNSRLRVFASNQRSTTHSSPAPSSNKSLSETAKPLSVDKSYPEAEVNEEPEDQCLSSRPTKSVLSGTSPVFGEPNPSSTDPSSRASPGYLPAQSSGSSTLTEVSCSTSNTPSTRKSHGKSHSRVTSPWDWDGRSSSYHDPPPRFAGARVVNPQRESSSPIFSPVTFSPPDTPSTLSRILSFSSVESSARCDAASPPPASRVGDQLPHIPRLLPPPVSVSAQTEIASLRGALEAARLREEKSRAEAECRAKDYDALSWRWTEERTRWHRREAELYAQIQHLTLALQMYAGSRPFSSATVPIFPAFVSSLPCAVPSTMTHRFCSPAIDSTRGRCRKRIQDSGEGNADSDEDVFPFNDRVAGAILKRPDSLRPGTRRNSTPPNEVGPLRFPSLSNLGNVWPSKEAEAENS